MKTSNVLVMLCAVIVLTGLLDLDDTLRLGILELAVSVSTLVAIWKDYRGKD